MALVVEDGTGVEGANTYVDAASAKEYALARGLSFDDETLIDALLVRAMDVLEAHRSRFKGTRLHGLQWPREGVVVDGIDVPSTAIPQELKNAQCQLAFELQTKDPDAATTPAVRERTVGPLTTVYAVADGETTRVRFPKVDAMLAPLLKVGGFTVERA